MKGKNYDPKPWQKILVITFIWLMAISAVIVVYEKIKILIH
ncbi:MAG: hypothetical protein WBB36_13175 [Chitinophagales bacterium]